MKGISVARAALVGLVLALSAPASASAEDRPEAFARVVVDELELRSGPGATFRVIGTARRGETLALAHASG